jgi:hypothetical protein
MSNLEISLQELTQRTTRLELVLLEKYSGIIAGDAEMEIDPFLNTLKLTDTVFLGWPRP